MTMHSTEELKRQMDAAASRLTNAKADFHAAEESYRASALRDAEAEFAARGITPGTKVIARWKDWAGGHSESTGIYVGHKWGRTLLRPDVRAINKDGSAHGVKTISSYSEKWEAAE